MAAKDETTWWDTCIYARKSTHKFAQRESVENQLSICNGEAPRRMLRIVDTKKDTATGTDDLNRPEIKEMIEEAKDGKYNCILMKGISRFFRDVEKGLTLIKMLDRHGVRIVTLEESFDSLTDRTANGKLDTSKITMYLMFAEMESKKTGDRVKFTQIDKARRGEWNHANSTPFGFGFNSATKKLQIEEDKADIVRMIFQLYVEGMGMRAIQHFLNGDNLEKRAYSSPRGSVWNQYTVGFILRNQAYAGDVVFNKRSKRERIYKQPELFGKTKEDIWIGNDHNDPEDWIVTPDAHEPIIDRETFAIAQEIMNTKATRKGIRSNVGLLAGMGKCAECGSGLTFKRGNRDPETGWIKTKNNYYCMNYIKYGRKLCTSHHIGAEELEGIVIQRLQALRSDRKILDHLFDANKATALDGGNKTAREKVKVDQEIKQIAEKMDKLLEKNLGGVISDEQFSLMNKRYRDELQQANMTLSKITDLQKNTVSADQYEQKFRNNINRLAAIEDMNKEQLRLLLLSLVERVELSHDGEIKIYYRFSNILQ